MPRRVSIATKFFLTYFVITGTALAFAGVAGYVQFKRYAIEEVDHSLVNQDPRAPRPGEAPPPERGRGPAPPRSAPERGSSGSPGPPYRPPSSTVGLTGSGRSPGGRGLGAFSRCRAAPALGSG